MTIPNPGHPESLKWTVHDERTIYEKAPWIRLVLADVEAPGNPERFDHHVVRLFRVAVSVVLRDDRVLMMWRHRFVSDQWGWELPGGIVESDEDGATAAARETEEETGWRPNDLQHVVTYQPMMGMIDAPHEIYLARNVDYIGEPDASEEASEVAWIPLSEVPGLLAKGELLGSGTLVGLLYVLAQIGPAQGAGLIEG